MHGVDQPVHLKNLSKRGLTESKASHLKIGNKD